MSQIDLNFIIDPPAAASDVTGLQVPCEVYSRIVGYLRPVQAWNKGKQQEFSDRVTFAMDGLTDYAPKPTDPQ